MEIAKKRALVTGGSSGIGFAIARKLLEAGACVDIAGRNADRLHMSVAALHGLGEVSGTVADVTTAAGREALLEKARAAGGLDILVNNAGGVRAGRLEAMPDDDIRAMVEVNLTAPMLLTRDALPMLRQSVDAAIMNVSSGIALVGMPFYAVYAGAKAGIARFGEALRRELANEGIRVLTVYPTATETPMMATSGMARAGGREDASDVAADVLQAIRDDRLEVVRGDPDRLGMIALNREDPAAIDEALCPSLRAMEEASRDHRAL